MGYVKCLCLGILIVYDWRVDEAGLCGLIVLVVEMFYWTKHVESVVLLQSKHID